MAYKGERDDHLTFRVPQANCDVYKTMSKNEEYFIEIKLPGYTADSWYSFMVRPYQVCFDAMYPDEYNIIEDINRNTVILISQKIIENGKRRTIHETKQMKSPIDIMCYFADCNIDNIAALRIGARL